MSGRPAAGRPRATSGARLPVSVLALDLATWFAGCTGALQGQVARQDAALYDLPTSVDGLRMDLRGLREETAGLRAALAERPALNRPGVLPEP